MISAVIFDRDNTLLAYDRDGGELLATRFRAVAPNLSIAAVHILWTDWAGSWPRQASDEPAFWRTFWEVLAPDYQLAEDTIATLCAICADYHFCFRAYDDAAACLTVLHQAGLKLGILTNGGLPSVAGTLQHAGIDAALFTAVLSRGSLGVWKPDPEAYYECARALDVPIDSCAFVDDLTENVVAARALGMQAFLLDRSRSTDDLPAGILSSLTALPLLLIPSP